MIHSGISLAAIVSKLVSEELLEMETHPITITDNAMSIINEQGKKVRCALKWKDQDAFEQLVADRLVS